MKYFYTTQQNETISVKIEASPVWELILGISGYTYAQLRHTFDLDEKWTLEQNTMPSNLVNHLKIIEETNFWYGMIMIQNKLSSSSVQEFSNLLLEMPIDEFYDTLLPYNNRETESSRKEIANKYLETQLFIKYAEYFDTHDYLGCYVRNIGHYTHQEICDLFIHTLDEWYNWISQREDWKKWIQALEFEKRQYSSLDIKNPIEEIERITGGVKYIPEPSVWTVKLIPHVSYRPWLLENRTPDTKLFFYPLKEEYLIEPGVPSVGLIRGHKALGDELRLKLLYQLQKGPLSLQDMSVQFNISKTTLHHQLSILKAAKFIRVDKGIYSANVQEIETFSGRLTQYLGSQI